MSTERIGRTTTLLLFALLLSSCGSEPKSTVAHSTLEDLDTPVAHLYLDEVHPAPGGADSIALYFRALDAFRENVDLIDLGRLALEQDGELVSEEIVLSELRNAESEGVSVTVTLDHSNVMLDDDALEDAKRAILELIEHIESEGWGRHAFSVVGFARDRTEIVPFGSSAEEARAKIAALEADTQAFSAALFDGLDFAVARLRETDARPRRGLVLLISDGHHNLEERDPEDRNRFLQPTHRIEALLAEADLGENRGRILIHTLGHPIPAWHEDHIDLLDDLASGSGGEYLRTRHPSELGALLRGVFDDANRSLKALVPARMDGQPHRLRLRVGRRSSDIHVAQYPEHFEISPGLVALGAAIVALAGVAAFVLFLLRPGRLILTGAEERGQTYRIRQGRTTIGAAATVDIQLVDPSISDHHATIVINGRTVYVEASDPANRLQVNGDPTPRRQLDPGDRLQIGDVEARFER